VLAAEWGTGQVLWSLFWFYILLLFLMMVFAIFGDIMRSADLSGIAKALWAIFIIVVPFFGIFIYLIVRGGTMHERPRAA